MMRERKKADAACLLVEARVTLFAIPITEGMETMRPLPIEALAGAPLGVLGLACVRGAAVQVIDLAAAHGDRPAPVTRWVRACAGGRAVALAVSAVIGVRPLAGVEVAAGALPSGAITRVIDLGGRAVRVVDVARLLPAEAADRA